MLIRRVGVYLVIYLQGVKPMIQVFGFWRSFERKTYECCRSFGANVRIWNVALKVNRIHRQKPKKVTVYALPG